MAPQEGPAGSGQKGWRRMATLPGPGEPCEGPHRPDPTRPDQAAPRPCGRALQGWGLRRAEAGPQGPPRRAGWGRLRGWGRACSSLGGSPACPGRKMGLPVPPTLLRLLKTLLGAEKYRSSQLRDPPPPAPRSPLGGSGQRRRSGSNRRRWETGAEGCPREPLQARLSNNQGPREGCLAPRGRDTDPQALRCPP